MIIVALEQKNIVFMFFLSHSASLLLLLLLLLILLLLLLLLLYHVWYSFTRFLLFVEVVQTNSVALCVVPGCAFFLLLDKSKN